MPGDKTTIALSRGTVQRLGEMGRFNETYEDVVTRLIEKANKDGGGSREQDDHS